MSTYNPLKLFCGFRVKNCKNISAIFFSISALLFLTSTSYSENKAQLAGRVVSKISEEPIENTIVYLIPGFRYAETNAQGEYVISNLEPGTYHVLTKHVGYNSDQTQQIDIKPGKTVNVNFHLTEMYYSSSDAIVVTATRAKSITQTLPHTMSVVSHERISLLNPLNIAETLTNIQGAYIKDYGGLGNLKTISLRGSNAGQVLVLLDGQRLNNPQTGEKDLSMISLDEIEQIEILRGGSSASYGADAIGGVLNLITRRAKTPKGIGVSLRALGGSFNTRSLDGSFDFNNDLVDGMVTYRRLTSEGDFSFTDPQGKEQLRDNNDVMSHNIFTSMKFQFGQKPLHTDLKISYGYYTSERGAPGPLDFPSLSARQWDTNQQFQGSVTGKLFNSLHIYTIQSFWNWNKTRFLEPEGFFATDAKNKSGNYGIESHIRSIILPYQILTYGAGYRQEWITSNQFLENHERTIYFFFLQDEIQFKPTIDDSQFSIEIIPAVRYDRYSDFGSRLSPKIGASISFGSQCQTILKSNAGLNFRAPTFNELYWPADAWSSGNPDLIPENGVDWDIGMYVRQPKFLNFSFDVVYFDVHLNDLIQWQTDSLFFSMPVNVSKATNKGVEIKASIDVIKDMVELIGNYTYLDSRNKSTGENYNNFLVYRSPHNFNLTLNWRWKFLSFVYDLTYASKRFSDEQNLSKYELKSYNVSDITFHFTKQFDEWRPTFTFQIRNIFNTNYQIIRSYPLSGREFRISLEITYH
jgi:outer membrane receptor for ferrienterochelin and colicins